jgi:hypothetical protein
MRSKRFTSPPPQSDHLATSQAGVKSDRKEQHPSGVVPQLAARVARALVQKPRDLRRTERRSACPPTPLLATLAWSARRVDGEQPGVLREREHRVHVPADLRHRLIAQALGTLAAEQRLDHLRLAVVHADRAERRHHVPVERALVVRGGARLEVRLYVLSQPLPAKLEHRHRTRDVAALVDGGL